VGDPARGVKPFQQGIYGRRNGIRQRHSSKIDPFCHRVGKTRRVRRDGKQGNCAVESIAGSQSGKACGWLRREEGHLGPFRPLRGDFARFGPEWLFSFCVRFYSGRHLAEALMGTQPERD